MQQGICEGKNSYISAIVVGLEEVLGRNEIFLLKAGSGIPK